MAYESDTDKRFKALFERMGWKYYSSSRSTRIYDLDRNHRIVVSALEDSETHEITDEFRITMRTGVMEAELYSIDPNIEENLQNIMPKGFGWDPGMITTATSVGIEFDVPWSADKKQIETAIEMVTKLVDHISQVVRDSRGSAAKRLLSFK